MNNDKLYQRWLKLFDNVASEVIETTFQDVERRYGESHRHYHTLEHVNACLNHLDAVANIDDRRALELALWFHDVIYDPFAKDNEAQSAQYAKDKLVQIGEQAELVDKVVHLIQLTQHPSHPISLDEQYLIDIDLSILGSTGAIYKKYEEWIRLEYRKVPGFLYKKGRRKVLQGFLDEKRIYSTDEYFNKLETQARKNISRALS